MRKLLLALIPLLQATAACAESWERPNTGGGKLVLTDRKCPRPGYPGLYAAYTYLSNGNVVHGCWVTLDGKNHVSWDNGERSVFEINSFTYVPGPAVPGNKAEITDKML